MEPQEEFPYGDEFKPIILQFEDDNDMNIGPSPPESEVFQYGVILNTFSRFEDSDFRWAECWDAVSYAQSLMSTSKKAYRGFTIFREIIQHFDNDAEMGCVTGPIGVPELTEINVFEGVTGYTGHGIDGTSI